jgi:RHS repeat-associated protein
VDTFTGKPDQIVSDEYDFEARELHNGQGRWISPDPMRGTGNKYAYADNNPLSKVDILGLFSAGFYGFTIFDDDDNPFDAALSAFYYSESGPVHPSQTNASTPSTDAPPTDSGSATGAGESQSVPAQQNQQPQTTPSQQAQAQQQNGQQGQQNQTSSAGHPIDKDAIVNYADQHAEKGSLKECATYCRKAFEAGGVDTKGHPIDAKDWGPTLLKNGAAVVSQDGYTPQKADVAVFGGNDAHPSGHITIYDGKQWVSDFKQRNMSPYGTSSTPPVTIYRFPDN